VRRGGAVFAAVIVLWAATVDGAPTATAAPRSLSARAASFPPLAHARAGFEQERRVSLVDEVLHARGNLVLDAPDRLRLELREPEAMTILTAGTTVTILDAGGHAVSLPPEAAGLAQFGKTLIDLLLGGRGVAGYAERWTGADEVTLEPSDPTAVPFAAIHMRFRADSPLPIEMTLTEAGGDRTTIRLRDPELKFGARG
jgi:outer membrane lipoprotein-sorting protein